MGPPHEGSIRRPIAPWANALTTELHLAPQIPKDIKTRLILQHLSQIHASVSCNFHKQLVADHKIRLVCKFHAWRLAISNVDAWMFFTTYFKSLLFVVVLEPPERMPPANSYSRPLPPEPINPQSAAGSIFNSLRGSAGSLVKNIKDASNKVMETVSA